MSPLPNKVWERSSRAFSDCSGEGRPRNPHRTPPRVCTPRPSPERGLKGPSDLSPAALGRGGLCHINSPSNLAQARGLRRVTSPKQSLGEVEQSLRRLLG
ncbi:hypothetical protein Rcae01_06574 [Novipirellula caenicola]|uniref:Uncharacterized protein n=1 Tax=Novipirellula caenicola TaxID=1536901 RepID=A0ABP9W1T8_9BACT